MATKQQIVSELDTFIERAIIKLTVNTTAELRSAPPVGTPIATGWARANWIARLNTRPSGVAGGSPESVNDSESTGSVAGVAASYRLPSKVYISNNVPYITFLNEGSSKQTPRGFVQDAIVKALGSIR